VCQAGEFAVVDGDEFEELVEAGMETESGDNGNHALTRLTGITYKLGCFFQTRVGQGDEVFTDFRSV
jgi:hypothetical protein